MQYFNIALTLLMLIVGLAGCARYQYTLIEPLPAGQIVPTTQPLTVATAPLEYRFGQTDDRLSVRISNPTEGPVYLLGSRSYVVDTLGQSHPIYSQTIAPHSYINLLIPPERPTYFVSPYYAGGYAYPYYAWEWDYGFMPPPPPTYVEVADLNPYYWEWNGPGQFRLLLVYRRGLNIFENRFAFVRRKL